MNLDVWARRLGPEMGINRERAWVRYVHCFVRWGILVMESHEGVDF